MTPSSSLHVIFGAGPVGLTLVDELVARGKQVRLVNRSPIAQLPTEVEFVVGDASSLAVVQELSQGADVLYHCMHAPYQHWPETLPRLQENLIESAAATNAKLIVIDTLYPYGETRGQPMSEATAYNATTRKGRLRGELAWGYLQAHRVGKAQVAIGRAADFFGPRVRNSALGQNIFPGAVANQPVLMLGNIDLPHSYSYMPDIARGLATLGERDEALGREWLLPVAPVTTTRAICDAIGVQLGYPLQIVTVASVHEAQELGAFDAVFAQEYAELFYQYHEPQIVDSRAIEQAFGLRATPLEIALPETIRWYQANA